jgi:hypothetical protein
MATCSVCLGEDLAGIRCARCRGLTCPLCSVRMFLLCPVCDRERFNRLRFSCATCGRSTRASQMLRCDACWDLHCARCGTCGTDDGKKKGHAHKK